MFLYTKMELFIKCYETGKMKGHFSKLFTCLSKNTSCKTENMLNFLLDHLDEINYVDEQNILMNLPSKFNYYFDKIFQLCMEKTECPTLDFLDYLYNLEDKSYYGQYYSKISVNLKPSQHIFKHLEKLGHYDLYNELFLKVNDRYASDYINVHILDSNGIEHYNKISQLPNIIPFELRNSKQLCNFNLVTNNNPNQNNFIDVLKLSYSELIKIAEEYGTALSPCYITLFLNYQNILEKNVEYITLDLSDRQLKPLLEKYGLPDSYDINIQYYAYDFFAFDTCNEDCISCLSFDLIDNVITYSKKKEELIAQFGTEKMLVFYEDLQRFDKYSYPDGIEFSQLFYFNSNVMERLPTELEDYYYNLKFGYLTIGQMCDTLCKYPEHRDLIREMMHNFVTCNNNIYGFENMTIDEFDILGNCFPMRYYSKYLKNIN